MPVCQVTFWLRMPGTATRDTFGTGPTENAGTRLRHTRNQRRNRLYVARVRCKRRVGVVLALGAGSVTLGMLRARVRRGLSTTSGNPLVASVLEWSGRTAFNRRGLLALAAGFFFGGGGLSGAALLSWNATAATPPEEDKQERRRRKAEAKLAAQENASDATISGLVRRWRWLWWPHWELAEAA